MLLLAIWFNGPSRSGKTDGLIREFCRWRESFRSRQSNLTSESRAVPFAPLADRPTGLWLAANESNRRALADQLAIANLGNRTIHCKTPLGFFTDEVHLFWPLILETLDLQSPFPLQLRPESEQDLATHFFRAHWPQPTDTLPVNEYRWVRRLLDLLQLAGAGGVAPEDIPVLLTQGQVSIAQGGLSQETMAIAEEAELVGQMLLAWRQWCLERGLLSYGLIYELYWRYLLPNPSYQSHLQQRYQGVFADDVDDYPAIAHDLLTLMLDQKAFGAFAASPDGQIRLGLGADPDCFEDLASRCEIRYFNRTVGIAPDWVATVVPTLSDPAALADSWGVMAPPSIRLIATTSRAQLLRQTAAIILQGIEQQQVRPEEIAIIGPGLDEIARYTLLEIMQARQIAVRPLNEQRPLNSVPLIRALLTLLALVFPGLGRWVGRDDVAEMLVVLSQPVEGLNPELQTQLETQSEPQPQPQSRHSPAIDPVRAGLLADYCFYSDIESPHLLEIEAFGRWDRLGYQATNAYQTLLTWFTQAKATVTTGSLPEAIALLEQAIDHFIGDPRRLPYEQLSALREFMETVQHYQEIQERLSAKDLKDTSSGAIVSLIQLLRQGTITANPRPLPAWSQAPNAITLATIFQYRAQRRHHRWQFWLDIASPLWQKGGAATLVGAPLFLRQWSGRPWDAEAEQQSEQQRLGRILRDLLARVDGQLFLCHSELDIYGAEQVGPLSPLIYSAHPTNLTE